ncbi:alpha/beta fold hydrolase [Salipaludibacillus daqingensis]|uniref:alpha/beta fold hydrolase n=1 Tax=Salipaludibacillus daqingensis TaxID=3041001 RepID=UPI00247360FB|nr:alpha/beta hydrolase [Salipaludibacillus daqingensis]
MPWTKDRNKDAIYFEKEGKGIPLLFVHPPSMGHVTFRRQKLELAKYFTVITMDLRGNGRSGHDGRPLSMELLADDVIRVLDAAKVKNAVICGYSNGGSIVQETAIRYPKRVRGLILMGGFSEVSTFLLKNEFRIGILAAKAKQMKLISIALAIAHEREWSIRKDLSDYILRMSPELLEEYYRIGLEYKATDRLKDINCPILLLYGSRDEYVHDYRLPFEKYAPGPVQTVLIDDVAHQLPTKRASAVKQIVKQFVSNTA